MELQQFIDKARTHGMSDQQITKLLLDQGWEERQVQTAILGLEVPRPTAAPIHNPASGHPISVEKKSIGPLEAALQHVMLWVFTLSTSIMIGVVSASLFGSDNSSSETLLTYLVVETVTFIPFCLIFVNYLRQFVRERDLATGKVWSILTIVFHSVGFIGSLITLLLVAILVHDKDTSAALVASGAICLMNAFVVTAYVTANFVKPQYVWRGIVIKFFPVALFVLIAIFGVIALTRVGPLRHDDQARQRLVTVVEAVHTNVKSNKKLPDNLSSLNVDSSGVTYKKTSSSTYSLCATFSTDNSKGDSYHADGPVNDAYADKYQFEHTTKGENCFAIESQDLTYTDPCDYRSPNYSYASNPCLNTK
jgi:hypothetical protein